MSVPNPLAVTLLALAPGDSLPVPLIEVDGPRVAYTVAQYADTTVLAWRVLDPEWVGSGVIEMPGEGEVLVLLIPRGGEGQSTGVDPIEPAPLPGQPGSGACGRFITWAW